MLNRVILYIILPKEGDFTEPLQLKYFKHTAKYESISRTAKKFIVAPSSVSASLKKLETELGVRLFDRYANSLKLNKYGEIFLKSLESCEAEMASARAVLLELSQSFSGELSLLILTNRRYVMDTIAKFKVKYPSISFKIKHDLKNDLNNYSDYDIVITDKTINSHKFDSKLFLHEEVCLAASLSHPLAKLKKLCVQNLDKENLICMPKGSSLGDFVSDFFKKLNSAPNIAIECDDPYCIREYTKMGLGVTFFPVISWKKQIDDSIHLLKIGNGIYRDSYLYIKKAAAPAASLFAKSLYEEL